MTNHETDRRAQWATALWEAAEQNTIAEWICCDPIDPKHGLCVAGGKALEMLRALIVDDPQSYKPAPLTTVALELAAAVSVPPPAPRADDRAALRQRIAEALCQMDAMTWLGCRWDNPAHGEVREHDEPIGQEALADRLADAVLAVLPAPADRAAVRAAAFDEAAEKLAGLDPVKAALAGQHAWNDAAGIVQHMARQERRMADEEQQPERPRCPHCGLPHDLSPSMELACASIRASIADHHPAVSGPVAGEQQAPLCRCGHGKAYHDAKYSDPQCRLCPEDGERMWRHAYTPAGGQQNETPDTESTGTRPCGHDDYHDGHQWADRPGVWCPGIGYDEPAAGVRQDGAQP